jgi:hypothetical protein
MESEVFVAATIALAMRATLTGQRYIVDGDEAVFAPEHIGAIARMPHKLTPDEWLAAYTAIVTPEWPAHMTPRQRGYVARRCYEAYVQFGLAVDRDGRPIPSGSPTAPGPTQERNMIKPTIGRVVWFWPGDVKRIMINILDPKQPHDAHITFVHSDTEINVAGFDHRGEPFSVHNVKLVQEGEAPYEGESHAAWMPYQQGQAKRHEAEAKTVGHETADKVG